MEILDIIASFITNKLIILPGLLIAITLHELSHGYTAYLLGDPTAKDNGRLTLNPIAHIDIMGFLLLFTVGFGWAKPVPINTMYFKNRKVGTILVSLSGPLMNFTIAFISTLIVTIVFVNYPQINPLVIEIIMYTILYNIVLGVFNLLPFPPLDGSKILASILPVKYEILFYKYERYLYIFLILMIVSNAIDRVLGPLVDFSYGALMRTVSLFF